MLNVFKKMYKDIMALVWIVLALILIAFFALYNSQLPEESKVNIFPKESKEVQQVKPEIGSLEENFYKSIMIEGRGNHKSGTFITILSDYACPWSNKFYNETVKPFLNSNDLSNVWLQYDFLSLGEQSPTLIASEAVYCANDQGKFWEMHELMFGLSNKEATLEKSFSKENIYAAAEKIGMDKSDFEKCLEAKKYRSLIFRRAAHYLEVFEKLGVPSTFINGQPITLFIEGRDQMVGAIDLNTFVEKINTMKGF